MRWEDEPYVRVYTRDTTSLKRVGWSGRAVLWELLRRVDRAGLLDLGHEDPAGDLAALLDMPDEVVSCGLSSLLARGCVSHNEGVLCVPNFIEAQTAKQSDKVRKQKERETARAVARASRPVTRSHAESHAVQEMAKSGHSVTNRDEMSRDVQFGHTESQPVTLSVAERSVAGDASPTSTTINPSLLSSLSMRDRTLPRTHEGAPSREASPAETRTVHLTLPMANAEPTMGQGGHGEDGEPPSPGTGHDEPVNGILAPTAVPQDVTHHALQTDERAGERRTTPPTGAAPPQARQVIPEPVWPSPGDPPRSRPIPRRRPATLPPPAPAPAPEAVSDEPEEAPTPTSDQRYARAYGAGISAATGAPYAFPGALYEQGALNTAALAHARGPGGKGLRGEAFTAWIRDAAEAFARAHLDKREFVRGFVPTKFAEWLNAGSYQPAVVEVERPRREWPKRPPLPEYMVRERILREQRRAEVEKQLEDIRNDPAFKNPPKRTKEDIDREVAEFEAKRDNLIEILERENLIDRSAS